MVKKDELLTISALNAAKIDSMDDSLLDIYAVTLGSFVDSFPAQEKALKAALEEKDNAAYSQCLITVWEMLKKINADELAEACFTQANSVNDTGPEALESFTTDFLAVLSMLSIDIQMATYEEQKEQQTKEAASAAQGEDDTSGNAILAVDDRAFFLNTLKQLLAGSGYKLTCLTSGAAALRYSQKHTPDLFILDIEMPEMDGYELAVKVREQGHKAPIIFLTGNAKKEYVLKAIQSGGSDFIVKPVSKTQVLERIGKYIKPIEEEDEEEE